MLDDLVAAGTEAACRGEGASHTADDHVDLCGVDVLVFGKAAARSAKDGEGPGLVEDEAEFVFELELDL
jgi:transcription initiation factor TFIIIB Brf1 subunit/transcription initiation factor TFIIB